MLGPTQKQTKKTVGQEKPSESIVIKEVY